MEPDLKRWPQPLTFSGVAEFAYVWWTSLFLFALAAALLAAATVVAFFELAWAPVLSQTIESLPASGAIRDGVLDWPAPRPVRITGTGFLGISIDPAESLEPNEGADVQIDLRRTQVRVWSLFGYLVVSYPKGYIVAINRTELEPWWGAWRPFLAVTLAGTVVVGLLVSWTVLGLLYAWPVRLIAFYADRALSWPGAWRLAMAALLPGALFMSVAVLAYALHRINLVQMLAASAGHILIGWIYVLFAPFSLRRDAKVAKPARNPFGSKPKRKRANPFSGGG